MKHKGFLLATTGGLAAAISGAQAADLPMKAAKLTPAPAPIASWTGFYVGLNAGAVWQMSSSDYGTGNSGEGVGGNKGHGVGFIGGGQIGYNYQIAPTWVLGLEADISGLTGKASGANALSCLNCGGGNFKGIEAQINWLSTFRGRVGWLMHQDTMLYATGGLAVGGVKNTWNPTGGVGLSAKSVSKTLVGWTAGGGIEHILNPNWTVAVEALYVDLGHSTGSNADGSKTSTFKNTAAIARLKLNYKF
jgi:outer membrane immunogenic protein